MKKQHHFSSSTVWKEAATHFKAAQPRLRSVGVLMPIAGLSQTPIRIEGAKLILGRDRSLAARILDESISRRHARVTRHIDEYILDDLDSVNGTFVDGVPIVSCLLHEGDTVQLGQTIYYFERVLEPEDAGRGDAR